MERKASADTNKPSVRLGCQLDQTDWVLRLELTLSFRIRTDCPPLSLKLDLCRDQVESVMQDLYQCSEEMDETLFQTLF